MTGTTNALRSFLDAAPACALVEIVDAKGSTPRDRGAWMLVAPGQIFGTIGGGQLEYMAIDEARRMLKGFRPSRSANESFSKDKALAIRSCLPSVSGFALDTSPPKDGVEDGPRQAWRPSSTLAKWGGGVERSETEGRSIEEAVQFRYEDNPPHKREGKTLSIPLGPEIGQCCGGRVELEMTMADDGLRTDLLARDEAEQRVLPHVYVFGGGHVGHALAAALALLPVLTVVVETRAEALEGMPSTVETRLTPVPEDVVRRAPPASAYVVLTHDHALDFLIVAEALKRSDAAYVGMIGSRTKKATFRSWARTHAPDADPGRLVSPIGGDAVRDKRPSVIAALAAAEIVTAVFTFHYRKITEVIGS